MQSKKILRICPKLAIVLSLAAAFMPGALAQDKTNKDAEAAYEPQSLPGAGQRFLEKLAGDWDVEKIFHPRNGPAVVNKGECHQEMINGGRFLKSDFIFYSSPTNTTGIGIIGFEPATGLFTSVWADSRSTKMSFRQSKEPFDGQEIVMFSQALGSGGVREAHSSRNQTMLQNDGKKIVHQQYAINSDGSDRLVFELILTKK